MDIRWEQDTGWPSQLDTIAHRDRVSALVRTASGFKIGMTIWPPSRVGTYGDAYDEMNVIYKTTSHKNAKTLEQILIGYYMENDDRCENKKRVGCIPGRGEYYYVYVVLRN